MVTSVEEVKLIGLKISFASRPGHIRQALKRSFMHTCEHWALYSHLA